MLQLLTVAIKKEQDIVFARQRARQIAELLGFDRQDQTRVATALSEIARNALEYGRGGSVKYAIEGKTAPQLFDITVSDEGPGIPHLDAVLAGEHRSKTGIGMGLVGARRLMDRFSIKSVPGKGTVVNLKKLLPREARVIAPGSVRSIVDQLRRNDADPLDELLRQNQELMLSLNEVERQKKELVTLNEELQDTNRGVVALYAELDEKAEHLRRADELKSRFLSNMSHEFRTPLNSILALSQLLLDRTDGPLNGEQVVQLEFVRKSAESLRELVDDLLDLAKVEAGKIDIRSNEFSAVDLFGALRGMLRPLLISDRLELTFTDVTHLPWLFTDEAKVSQILRNLISNSLKFTESGEIRVAAEILGDSDEVQFSVQDSGIGIAAEDQEVIFREFSQLDSPLQRKVKGTGLGLPLSRRLAELLGGSLTVKSRSGKGATFFLRIPRCYSAIQATSARPSKEAVAAIEDDRLPVLAIEDNAADMMVYEALLRASSFRLYGASSISEGRRLLFKVRPRAIILDILLNGEDSWQLLTELKREPEMHHVPVLVVTSVDDRQKALGLGADDYGLKPIERTWLLSKLHALIENAGAARVLLIEDDEASRYIIRRSLARGPYVIREAATGEDGLLSASEDPPDLVLLDLKLPGISGFEVLQRLSSSPRTSAVPVVVVTSSQLRGEEINGLGAAKLVVSKAGISTESLMPVLATVLSSEASK